MKLSNGSAWEFILGLVFVYTGFHCTEIVSMMIFIIGGSLASGHCIYLWFKKRKENKNKQKKEQ